MLRMCSIASGSSGNCICIGSDKNHVLIDAGISGKKIETGLAHMDISARDDIRGILVTHEHIDHVQGLGVMARRYGLPIYATEKTIGAIKYIKSLGTIDEDLYVPVVGGSDFDIGDLHVETIPISHDAADPIAYKISCGDKSMAVVTDLGTYTEEIIEKLQGLDGLVLRLIMISGCLS